MPDREKVIDRLETAVMQMHGSERYTPEDVDELEMAGWDALALLKEQDEGVTPIESTTEQKKFADRIGLAVSEFWCGACHFNLVGCPKFCPNCGTKVKWDD